MCSLVCIPVRATATSGMTILPQGNRMNGPTPALFQCVVLRLSGGVTFLHLISEPPFLLITLLTEWIG